MRANAELQGFRVYRDHAHCFGCGWHGDQIGWLVGHERLGFLGAVHHLCNWSGVADPTWVDLDLEPRRVECEWRPIRPIPCDASPLIGNGGVTVRVFNPKRAGDRWEWASWRPAMVHPYSSVAGEPLGYVLRIVPKSGKKFTPTVTYCKNPNGESRWCIAPFTRPLPLYGLDRLGARPLATVMLVEGEKTAEAAQRLLPAAVATTWPGGSKSYRHVDFSALRGRKVICAPDADQTGRDAFSGCRDQRGKHVPGILEMLAGIGATTRLVEPEPTLPEGWDLADAEAEGWTTVRALAWLKSRMSEVCDAG